MRIGLYVGTFNPPHIGHLNIVKTAMDKLWLDEVVVLPSDNSCVGNETDLASPSDCYAMCVRCFEENIPSVNVSNDKLRHDKLLLIDTIRLYRITEPKDKLFLIFDEDSFRQLMELENAEDIIKLVPIVVVARSNCYSSNYVCAKYDIQSKTGLEINSILVCSAGVEIFDDDLSSDNKLISSFIRKNIKEGKRWSHLVPEGVEEYIKEKQLYV